MDGDNPLLIPGRPISLIMVQTDMSPSLDIDALIVGAGFGGLYMLHKLRSIGLSVKACEAASDLGGIWHINRYPGLRADSECQVYQYSDENLWKNWVWPEKYAARSDILAYFRYVDEQWQLRKDVLFDTQITHAEFDEGTKIWMVRSSSGRKFRARYLILSTGILNRPYIPDFKGLESFNGLCCHPCQWPQTPLQLKNKRVGIVGTASTGVQLIQQLAPEVAQLVVFQRTPNFSLPLYQQQYSSKDTVQQKKSLVPAMLGRRVQTDGGFHFTWNANSPSKATPEERHLFYEDLWAKGGLQFWLGNYPDLLSDKILNKEIYNFWRSKTILRIHDPAVQEKLAPADPPHPFGVKRPALESSYFETFNRENVQLVDILENPITEVVPQGVKTGDGREYELDVLILATGYDAVSGGITNIEIRGTDGVLIGEKWAKGVSTHLGYMSANFPNMFIVYGPQSPAMFCNGPTCIELQGNWITSTLLHMRENNYDRVEADKAAEETWRRFVNELAEQAMFNEADWSCYLGTNIPGKPVESVNFTGGVQLYLQKVRESVEQGYAGLKFTKSASDAVI